MPTIMPTLRASGSTGIVHIRSVIVGLVLCVAAIPAVRATDAPAAQAITLDDPELSYAVDMLSVAQEAARQASAARWPSVTLRGQWRLRPAFGGVIGNGASGSTSLSLNLTIPVIDEASRHNRAAAGLMARVGNARVEAATQEALLRRGIGVLAVERDRELLRLAGQNELALASLVDMARMRFEAGLAAVGDVYEAVSANAVASRARIDAQLRLDDSLVALRLMGGASAPALPSIASSWRVGQRFRAESEEDVVERALRHPRVEAAQHDLAASERRLAAARVTYLPKLHLQASYGVSSRRESPAWIASAGSRTHRRSRATVMLVLKLPLHGASSPAALVRRGIADRDVKIDALDDLRRDAVRDTRRLYRRTRTDRMLLAATHSAVAAAEVAVDAVSTGLAAGTHSWPQRLRGESRLAASRIEHCRARYAAIENELSLLQLVGELTADSLLRPGSKDPDACGVSRADSRQP
jgi:outer membrane protein